jgi:F-type H+-transporting ATPase subunit c
MTKTRQALILALFFGLIAAAPALAQEGAPPSDTKADLYKLSLIVAGGIITLAVAAGAFCQAKALSAACEGISRNPAGAPHIRFLLLLGLILIETLVIYALLVTFIILMVKWGSYA